MAHALLRQHCQYSGFFVVSVFTASMYNLNVTCELLYWSTKTTRYKVIVFLAILSLTCESSYYSWDELLFHRASLWSNTKPVVVKPRKRGKRGGIRCPVRRRPFKQPVPTIIMSNVQSLCNNMDLLGVRCSFERAFRDTCIMPSRRPGLKSQYLTRRCT